MGKFVKGAALALAVSWALGGIASAQLTSDELKAQKGTNSAGAKFTAAKAKCIQKCLAAQYKIAANKDDCLSPTYSNPAVNTCIFDAAKGAEAKAIAAIVKATAKDCPECYSGGCSAAAFPTTRVNDLESQIDPFGGLVACEASPTADQFKCETGVSKSLVKLVAARNKCYDKCFDNAFKGKIPSASACVPPASDPATTACLSDPVKGTEVKAAAAIDKICALKSANPPCYGTSFDTGAEWVNLTSTAVDGNVGNTYCGSASGAFVD